MSLSARGQPRINLPDIQRDSIVEISQRLSVVAGGLRDPNAAFNLEEVESLILQLQPKVKELDRIVKGITREIRSRKREERRRLEQQTGNNKRKPPRSHLRRRARSRASEQQMARIEQRSLQESPAENGGEFIGSTTQSDDIRQTRLRTLSDSSNAIDTTNLTDEVEENNNPDPCVLSSERCASSLAIDAIAEVEITGHDQEYEDIRCDSLRSDSEQHDHDAFSRELASIFNQSIGEDPSGFLGTIDTEDDVTMLNSLAFESDSDQGRTAIEIPKEGPPEDLEQLTEGATVAYGFSDDTLERLLPGVKLIETTILDVLNATLHSTAEPLIARWAIENFPRHGLAGVFDASSGSLPMLRHKLSSTHLFLAYNVDLGTLNCDDEGDGDSWVLVVVDFLGSRVHVFGTENNLELQGDAIGSNVGTFVNNYRVNQGKDAVQWSKPQNHSLYPFGIVPDDYNSGICVVYRAETFIWPEKSLDVSENTTPAALSKQLNRLRSRYRSYFLGQYANLCAEKTLQAYIISSIPRKGPFLTDCSDKGLASQPVKIPRCFLQSRPTSLNIESRLTVSNEWKDCLFRCAESNGFAGEPIVKAFEKVPAPNLSSALRALQCMCEVANPNLLLRLKRILTSGNETLFRQSWPSEPKTLVEIAELHRAIDWFNDPDPSLLIFKASFCQISYHVSFQRRVNSLSTRLKKERKRRKRLRGRRSGDGQEEARQYPLDNSNARQQVMSKVVDLICAESTDRKSVEDAVKRYEKAGRILSLLKGCRNPFWLLLYPLYDDQSASFDVARQPSLNIMDFEPPEDLTKLRKPISRADLVEMTGPMAEYFGYSLSIARPELDDVTLNRENGQLSYRMPILSKSDEEILTTKPRDVARLFKDPEATS